jgi:hypothetical protein
MRYYALVFSHRCSEGRCPWYIPALLADRLPAVRRSSRATLYSRLRKALITLISVIPGP